jgi:hypothetical protein
MKCVPTLKQNTPIKTQFKVIACFAHSFKKKENYGPNLTSLNMEWMASILHTTSEYDVSSITTAVAHTSAASGGLN